MIITHSPTTALAWLAGRRNVWSWHLAEVPKAEPDFR
jgi:hypothetical protein